MSSRQIAYVIVTIAVGKESVRASELLSSVVHKTREKRLCTRDLNCKAKAGIAVGLEKGSVDQVSYCDFFAFGYSECVIVLGDSDIHRLRYRDRVIEIEILESQKYRHKLCYGGRLHLGIDVLAEKHCS